MDVVTLQRSKHYIEGLNKKDILMYDNLIAEEQAVIDKFDEIKASREIYQ